MPSSTEELREYLKREFELRLKKDPYYSIRTFAKDLDIAKSTLSRFMNGSGNLSSQNVEKSIAILAGQKRTSSYNLAMLLDSGFFDGKDLHWQQAALFVLASEKHSSQNGTVENFSSILQLPQTEIKLLLEELCTLRVLSQNGECFEPVAPLVFFPK